MSNYGTHPEAERAYAECHKAQKADARKLKKNLDPIRKYFRIWYPEYTVMSDDELKAMIHEQPNCQRASIARAILAIRALEVSA